METHQAILQNNYRRWKKKPLLRRLYREYYARIREHLITPHDGVVVELGSGCGNIQEVIPYCLRTDAFSTTWTDRVENAYELSFPNNSVSNLILFDVFHHLRYSGQALNEFHRVLIPHGRVILFEPCLSVLGLLVYGLFHKEPLGLTTPLKWLAPPGYYMAECCDYYASQANTTRIFLSQSFNDRLSGWEIVVRQKFSAISYVASGGYSKPQLYPDNMLGMMEFLDRLGDMMPWWLCATRLLIVLQKVSASEKDDNSTRSV